MKNKLAVALCLITIISRSQIINTIAGGGALLSNISATQAVLNQPAGIAIDANDNIYFTDPGSSVVRKISTSGILTIYAGNGTVGNSGDGGPATAALINGPTGIVRDKIGNTYFADSREDRIKKVSPSGIITTIAGTGIAGFGGDGGPAVLAQLNFPQGLAIDTLDNIYVADNLNHRIRKITPGGIITTVAGSGLLGFSGDGGLALAAKLNTPFGVHVDKFGVIYIADSYNFRIRKVATNGIITTDAGNGFPFSSGVGGPAISAGLIPVDIKKDTSGNIFLTDYAGNKIRKINTSGIITTVAGTGIAGFSGDGGPATSAQLNFARAMIVKKDGTIFFCDGQNSRVRKITSSGIISTIAGTLAPVYTYPTTQIVQPFGSSINRATGEVYHTDYFGYVIKKVNLSSGLMKTVAGTGIAGFSGDGGLATDAQLDTITGVFSDTSGVYICDAGNKRIRKIDNNGIISTIVGDGTIGFSGDGGPATSAKINFPSDLTVFNNKLYFADRENARIRKVDLATGIITTIAGTGAFAFSGDNGPAISASIGRCYSIAHDKYGNLYLSQPGAGRIRKISTSGIITTIAGNGTAGFAGDNGLATLSVINGPWGVCVDDLDNIYIADHGNNRIRKINASGIITTYAGTGVQGYSGDGGSATNAQIAQVYDISVDAKGNSLAISDQGNNRVRLISSLTIPDICLVSTDTLSNFNQITWEKTNYFNVDTFLIYREVSSNPSIYSKVGAVPASAYSEFTDTNRVYYTNLNQPNGNPRVGTYRYKIKIRDLQNNFSFSSKYHNTVFINDQQNGTFTWNFYDIESTTSPITTYQLQRSNNGINNWQVVNTVSGSQNIIIDPNYSTYTATALWRVEAQGFSCNPTLKTGNAFALKTRTKSNQTNEKTFPVQGVKENNISNLEVTIYPNPSKGIVNIDFLNVSQNFNYKLQITNTLGQEVYQTELYNQRSTINVQTLKSGIYFLNIKQNDNVLSAKKIIVE